MRRTSGWIALGIATMLISQTVRAQELRIVTLDQKTKAPVAGALISLVSRRSEVLDTTRTGADGSFTIRAKQGGKYFLRVSRTGFPTEETDAIFLNDGETRVDTLYVAAARALPVDELVAREVARLFGVSTAVLPKRAVLLPSDIDPVRGSARSVSDVVMQIGPASVQVLGAGTGRACYQIHGGGCALIYVNGQPVPSSTDFSAQDVEAIVVLSPLDVQTALGRTGGVVLLFTRGMLRR